MSKFEDHLWRDLVRRHGADLADMTRPAPKRARRARPRLLAGTTVSLAGVGTAAVLLLSAASSPAAFAVNRNADGSVTVSLHELAAIRAANARLAALGVRAKIVEVTPSCAYRALPPAALKAMALAKSVAAGDAHRNSVIRLDPHKIPAGKWQVLPVWRDAGDVKIAPARVAAVSALRCISTLPSSSVVKCAGGANGQGPKTGPPPPTFSGQIRRTRATAKAAAASDAAKNPPSWVVIGCAVITAAPAADPGNTVHLGKSRSDGTG